ncbi:MAG: hypothetical protein VX222_03860, partial [Actinomycetota bacterium]|nr:hypothetical protein [Actinomycetota bacterium]
ADFTDVSVAEVSKSSVAATCVVALSGRSVMAESPELEHAQTKNKNPIQAPRDFTGLLCPPSLLHLFFVGNSHRRPARR